ncbi:MAG: FAD-dependent oxidoreductase, partial [Gammaproteobacteria bacterium]
DQIGHDGMKIGFHGPGTPVDPDDHERAPDPRVVERFRNHLERYLPGMLEEPVAAVTCLYTMSADQHFVIDCVPDTPAIAFAAGFSGHGYKFAPVIGELLADLALEGCSELPANFLRLGRFTEL